MTATGGTGATTSGQPDAGSTAASVGGASATSDAGSATASTGGAGATAGGSSDADSLGGSLSEAISAVVDAATDAALASGGTSYSHTHSSVEEKHESVSHVSTVTAGGTGTQQVEAVQSNSVSTSNVASANQSEGD